MSAQKGYSDVKKPNRPGEFIFTWFIRNYSYCTKKRNEFLQSPDFVVESLGDVKWWLKIYPKGDNDHGFFVCYLLGCEGDRQCEFMLSIQKSDEQFQEEGELIYYDPFGSSGYYSEFVILEELKQPDSSYLVDDTLTIRCRIWKTDSDVPPPGKCDVHSRIKISELNYTWILKVIEVLSDNALSYKFNQTNNLTECFPEFRTLKIHLLNGGHSGEDVIHFGIEMGAQQFHLNCVCVIHLLDDDGQEVHSARGEHLFDSLEPTENWNFPIISKNHLYLNKNVYLPNGRLTLKCQIGFTSGDLETFEYRKTYKKIPDMLEQDPNGQELWIENMQECFLGGKFSDFIIRTPGKQFPVHKAILSAHSEVFGAMFERDMKESNSGVVDIEDLGDDTVFQMLTFLYTNTIENLNCTSVQELYFAADKYRIKPLQKKCSNNLMCGLNVSNVCDILVLADRHHDQELKSRARDFINAHTREIIVSEAWKKLMVTNPHLTTDVLQSVVCNKLL